MKKIILTCLLFVLTLSIQAQEDKYAAKRAANAISFISSNMEISESDATFLEKTLYNKYATNASKIRGKDLTNDEKKQIYRSAFVETRKKLMDVFSKAQVDEITVLERKANTK
jgi:predicted aminopeptidase